MKKSEIENLIERYGVTNEQKNALAAEVKDMGEEIKDYFAEEGESVIDTTNFTAKITIRKSKKLDIAKVSALLGYPIPAECYEETETEVLTVKPRKADAIAMPKVA